MDKWSCGLLKQLFFEGKSWTPFEIKWLPPNLPGLESSPLGIHLKLGSL